jgi:hypothetical protein
VTKAFGCEENVGLGSAIYISIYLCLYLSIYIDLYIYIYIYVGYSVPYGTVTNARFKKPS